LRVWIACLLSASWKEKKWFDGTKEITIPRGSFITSREHFAAKCRVSEHQFRDAIETLKKTKNASSRTSNRYTLISVLNYDSYQSSGETISEKGPAEGPAGRPAEGQQGATYKKAISIEEKKTPEFSVKSEPQNPSAGWFVEFGKIHPKSPLQLPRAKKYWVENVTTETVYHYLMDVLRREKSAEGTYFPGMFDWLESHMEAYRMGITPNVPGEKKIQYFDPETITGKRESA
jgi:hypothetical protein